MGGSFSPKLSNIYSIIYDTIKRGKCQEKEERLFVLHERAGGDLASPGGRMAGRGRKTHPKSDLISCKDVGDFVQFRREPVQGKTEHMFDDMRVSAPKYEQKFDIFTKTYVRMRINVRS